MDILSGNNKHFEGTNNLTDKAKYGDRLSGTEGRQLIIKNIYGCLAYYIIFIVAIPYLIFKSGNLEILEVYIPNIDLIATVLSFFNGPYGALEFLYLDERPLLGFISNNIINYVVLISLFYIILNQTLKHNRISYGLSRVSIILITTYLLPNRFIIEIMHRFYDYIGGKEPTSKELIHGLVNIDNISWVMTIGLGLMISSGIIGLEAFLIKLFSRKIAVFMENIFKKF